MEYIFLLAIIGIALVIYVISCFTAARDRRRKLRLHFETEYGKKLPKVYPDGRFRNMAKFLKKRSKEFILDDITWSDLSLDDLFLKMDFTVSAAGEEALYQILRTPCMDAKELTKRDELICYFMEHEKQRVDLQMFFAQLGRGGRYSIYEYLDYMQKLEEKSNTKDIVVLIAMGLSLALCFFSPGTGLFLLAGLLIYNFFTYFKEKEQADIYITTFAYFLRLLDAQQKIASYQIDILADLMEQMEERRHRFDGFARFSFILMSQNSQSGNPLDVVLEYVRMATHLNLMKFRSMVSDVKKGAQDLCFILETMGYIEAMIAIGAYRKSLKTYCKPQLSEDEGLQKLSAKQLYHPLIESPVCNDLSLSKGMLLTGSNASGKSTFLKTVAISQLLAQTIYTVPAEGFTSGFYRIYSSMSLRDDLENQDSYFMVEIKALKRILEAQEKADKQNDAKWPVMCFVDEVLRGTNTVERIAASTQILQGLQEMGVFVFAATHDIELTSLLEKSLDNYHFTEVIENGDVLFSYKLLEGKANSRNAIKLLQLLGFSGEITQNAQDRADAFLKTGEWKI